MADDVKELGHSTMPRWSPRVGKHNKLSWSAQQREFVEMRNTAKVAQVENAIRKPVEQATWSVEPNGAPDSIVDLITGDLSLPVKGEDGQTPRTTGRVSFSEHLTVALEGVFSGVAFFEKVYEIGEDGLVHLRKLAHRPNLTIRHIHTADDGGLEGITQYGVRGKKDVFIPVSRLVVYRYGTRDNSWHGSSVFAPARDNWLELMKLQKLNSSVLQRNGMGIPKYKASAVTQKEDRNRELELGQQMAESYAAGHLTAYALPAGADMPVEGVSGSLPDIPASMEYHANQIAISCNATHLNLTGAGGSYALANVQLGEFLQGLQAITEWVSDTVSKYVVNALVELAFPDYDGPVPLVTSTRIQVQKDLTPGDISQLAAQGVLTREPNLEGWVRSTFRIPKARDLSDALRAKKQRQEMEQQLGVSLTDSGSVDDVARTAETNARYRAVKVEQEEIERLIDAKLAHLRGSYE